jgi:hydroxypyruvate reductase
VQGTGLPAVVLGDFTGEASLVGRKLAAVAREVRASGAPAPPPVALISGGECTVTLSGPGRGGRCSELLLSLLLDLDGLPDVWALAADTDGIDGTEDNAGALVTPDSRARARAAGLDPEAALRGHDSYGFFAALGDLVVTGPTRTNVNEYRIVVV